MNVGLPHRIVAAASLFLTPLAINAQAVYKSVNPDGTVSYGDKPAASAASIEQVEILPPPSTDEVLEQMLITERIKESAAALATERRAKEQARADERARQEAQEAELRARQQAAAEAAELERLAQQDANKRKKRKTQKKNNHPPALDVPVPWSTPGPDAINMNSGTPLLNLPGPAE